MDLTALPTTTVAELSDPPPEGVTFLDVRERVEWEHGHIPGALHVPIRELPARRQELPEGDVIVVCRIGARSSQVVAWLSESGHAVSNLVGGMIEWTAAGRAVVSETGEPPRIV